MWTLFSLPVLAGGPTSGTLIGSASGDLMDYECLQSSSERLTCEFTQVMLRKGANEEDWVRDLALIPKMIQDPKEMQNFDATCANFLLPMERGFINGFDDEIWDALTGVDDRAELEEQIAKEDDFLKEFVFKGAAFCRSKTSESAIEFFRVGHERALQTCSPFFNKFSQSFVKVSEELWVVESAPSGGCGIINTSRFTTDAENSKYGLWSYYASKIITNKVGKATSGISCEIFDESINEYKWNADSNRVDCVYLK